MRLWGSGRRRDTADDALAAYVEWRSECDAVRVAYHKWLGARALDEPRAFDAYKAALDREESAAALFARARDAAGAPTCRNRARIAARSESDGVRDVTRMAIAASHSSALIRAARILARTTLARDRQGRHLRVAT